MVLIVLSFPSIACWKCVYSGLKKHDTWINTAGEDQLLHHKSYSFCSEDLKNILDFQEFYLCEREIWGIMSQSCRLLCGFFLSCSGWICLIVATSTNDWVIICSFNMNACNKMEQETKGLWAECVISTALYHCLALNHILSLPGETHTHTPYTHTFILTVPFLLERVHL